MSDLANTRQPNKSETLPDDVVLAVRQVGKMYPLYDEPADRLKQSLWYGMPAFARRRLRPENPQFFREFWALKDVSFSLKRGETVGVIGINGSGKSTLLQMLAGTLAPTQGEIELRGRTAALLELGSGFNPEFTGRENLFLSGALMGFSQAEMQAKYDDIIRFADIGDFIDQPVKYYSSGMYLRLAFAVQTAIEPDILILDEILSVGDVFFQQKCFAKIDEMLARQTSVVLVSHDLAAIERYSSQVLLLHKGEPHFWGSPNEAVQRFYLLEREEKQGGMPASSTTSATYKSIDSIPWPAPDAFLDLSQAGWLNGSKIGQAQVAICDANGQRCHLFGMGDTAYFYCEFETTEPIGVPIAGVTITNHMNVNVHGKNSAQGTLSAPATVASGSRVRFCQQIKLDLAPGQYSFSQGLSTIAEADYLRFAERPYAMFHDLAEVLLVIQNAGMLQVTRRQTTPDLPFHGIAELPNQFTIEVIRA